MSYDEDNFADSFTAARFGLDVPARSVALTQVAQAARRLSDGTAARLTASQRISVGSLAAVLAEAANASARRPGEALRDRLVRERDSLEAGLAAVAVQLARRNEQIAHLDRYPAEDPFADATTLEFVKRFPNSDREYTYVARRIDGLWYLTGGRSPQAVDWPGLVEFMGLGVDQVFQLGGRGGRRKVLG